MANISETDLQVWLQTLSIKLAAFGDKVATQLQYGLKSAECNLVKLEWGLGMLDALRDYMFIGRVIQGNTVAESDNCFTDAKAKSMFEKLASEFNVTLAPPGTSYVNPLNEYKQFEDGVYFEFEDGVQFDFED